MLESMYAGFKAGCGVVPINFRLHPKEYASIIKHSEAKTLVLSPEFNEEIIKAREGFPRVRSIITLSGAHDNVLDYESLLAVESDQFNDAEVDAEDVAWIFYTSGTTGNPKGAMLTHRNLLAMTMNFYADMAPGFGSSDVALHAAPLSHGSGCYALPNIARGAANAILKSKSFDPETVLRTIQEHRVTNMFAAPTMIKRLIDSPAINRCDHSSLKYLTYGGAPMLVEDLINAMQKLGPCLVQLYGQAESPMTITYLSHDDHVLDGDSDQMKRLASAGIPRTDVEVKVVGPDGNELPPGETGEIVTRSDLVMKGYWRSPEATAEALRDGWLYTDDMGYIDERGYLFLMDRSKDMIISGGENIYPREIEDVIVGHPAVREVAVIGVPDPQWGEEIKAIVSLVPGSNVTETELVDFCTEHIARYKKPRSVEFVDELPKNNYGKIVKRELREKYWKGRTSRVI
jgi:acyl-CoA synthetase (AMP-forming)/AMP-acid ligase II